MAIRSAVFSRLCSRTARPLAWLICESKYCLIARERSAHHGCVSLGGYAIPTMNFHQGCPCQSPVRYKSAYEVASAFPADPFKNIVGSDERMIYLIIQGAV